MAEKKPASPLERLFRLQELLLEARDKTDRRGRTPDHLIHVEAAFQEMLKKRQETTGQLATAEARKKDLDAALSDFGEKLKKFQQQLHAVKTTREYSAVLNEIETVKREIRAHEDELLGIEEAIGAARAEAAAHEESFPAEEASYEEQMAGWREEQARLAAEAGRAEAAASELRKGLDKRLVSHFDRIAKMRSGVAVARVSMVATQTAACSACNVRLRPQLLSDLRLSKDLITCESCKRILYWDATSE